MVVAKAERLDGLVVGEDDRGRAKVGRGRREGLPGLLVVVFLLLFVILLAPLNEEVVEDLSADAMLELETDGVEVDLELLDDGNTADGRESIPEQRGEDVHLAELVVGHALALGDDLGKDVLGRAVERLEIFDDESIRDGAVLLADPRELDAVDRELDEGRVGSVEHVVDELRRPRLELHAGSGARHLGRSVHVLRLRDGIDDERELLPESRRLRSADEEVDAALVVQLVEMDLVELLEHELSSDALLKVLDDVGDAEEVGEVVGEDDGLELGVPRLASGIAVEEQVGDDVVNGGEVVGVGGDGELVALDRDAICEPSQRGKARASLVLTGSRVEMSRLRTMRVETSRVEVLGAEAKLIELVVAKGGRSARDDSVEAPRLDAQVDEGLEGYKSGLESRADA
jgi:hypothetical protein